MLNEFWSAYSDLARREHLLHRRIGERTSLHDRIVGHMMECGHDRRHASQAVIDYEHSFMELGRERGRMEGMVDALCLFTGLTRDEAMDRAASVRENIDEF